MNSLIIRKEQLAIFARNREEAFLAGLLRRLREEFPSQTSGMGDADLRKRIESAVAAAREFGLTRRDDFYRLLSIRVCFGWDFERDPACRWMTAILHDSQVRDPVHRLHRLLRACIRRLEVDIENRERRKRFATAIQ